MCARELGGGGLPQSAAAPTEFPRTHTSTFLFWLRPFSSWRGGRQRLEDRWVRARSSQFSASHPSRGSLTFYNSTRRTRRTRRKDFPLIKTASSLQWFSASSRRGPTSCRRAKRRRNQNGEQVLQVDHSLTLQGGTGWSAFYSLQDIKGTHYRPEKN